MPKGGQRYPFVMKPLCEGAAIPTHTHAYRTLAHIYIHTHIQEFMTVTISKRATRCIGTR